MTLRAFLARNLVFTQDAYRKAFPEGAGEAAQRRLYRLQQAGLIMPLGRALYASVPGDADADVYTPDPFLIMHARVPSAIFCGHSALELNGIAYSTWRVTTAYSHGRRVVFHAANTTFRPMAPPSVLSPEAHQTLGVRSFDRAGVSIRGLGPERMLVEGFRSPGSYGGLVEFIASIDNLERIKFNLLEEILGAFNERRLYACVGWFLEKRADALGVDRDLLARLLSHQPKSPVYLARDMGSVRRAAPWNLLVPERLNRTEEFDAAEY